MAEQALLSPPRAITMEEFRASWEPKGWRLLIVGPTSTWRQEWGEWEAIRDLVQNALDEGESYSWGYDSQGLWLRDHGKGLAVADLLLGPPKTKPTHARGRYGEGMKVAALALLRQGYSVRIETAGKEIWLAFLKTRVDGAREAEQLAALWREDGASKGTTFHIVGYTGEAFADRFAVNIPRRDILHEGPSLLDKPISRFNQLICLPAGRLYVRDVYVKDIDSPFSYNLWSVDLSPDRHGAKSESDVWLDMGRLWATVTKVELLERFLAMMKDPPEEKSAESYNLSLETWSIGAEPRSDKPYSDFIAQQGYAWREAWRRRMGEDAVLRTSDRWDGTVRHLGYQPVGLSWTVRDALALAIPTDASLVSSSQERLREVQAIPEGNLGRLQSVHLSLARRIASLWSSPVAGVHAALIPPASDRVRTAGMYSMVTREVFIAPEQLERASTTVDTVIHEIAHHTSGADDGDEAHGAAMTRVAARVVKAAGQGELDEFLKGATW